MANFVISAFADEAATDIFEQIAACKKHNIPYIELRNYSLRGETKNISNITVEEAKELKDILDENGMGVSAIGSHYGKIEITDDFLPHYNAFKQTVEVAKILGTKNIRMFSFFFTKGQSREEYRSEVMDRVKRMAEYSYERGILCCHENEKEIYGDIADACVDLHTEIPALGGIFDPSNYIQCGENTIEAYDKVEKYLTYFHIKDCKAKTGTVVPCGFGDGNIAILLSRFSAFKGDRFLTLEPHLKVFDGLAALDKNSAKLAEDSLFQYPDLAHSFAAAVDAFYKILESLKV